jgi:hypothetical protein
VDSQEPLTKPPATEKPPEGSSGMKVVINASLLTSQWLHL